MTPYLAALDRRRPHQVEPDIGIIVGRPARPSSIVEPD
jgi:hypothetical protein